MSILGENAKLQDNLKALSKDYKNLTLKATQLKREIKNVKHVKVDLESRSEKLDHILSGLVRFANENGGLGYDKFGGSSSNFKAKLILFKSDNKNKNLRKEKPVWQIQAMKAPKVSSQVKVLKVIPFDTYKHTLP